MTARLLKIVNSPFYGFAYGVPGKIDSVSRAITIIGSLLIYQKIPELAREALLRAWNLPTHLEEAVAFHHAPEKATHFPVDAALIHLANIIATAVCFGNSGNQCVAPLQNAAWDIIGLSASVIEPVVIEAETHFGETLRLLQPDAG